MAKLLEYAVAGALPVFWQIQRMRQRIGVASFGAAMVVTAAMAFAQTGTDTQKTSTAVTPAAPNATRTAKASPYRRAQMTMHAKDHYELLWGIDSLQVKAVESGQMIRFSYLVLDPAKAAQLNDKKANPVLIDTQARVKLDVPTMEKVGQLRQSSAPESGKSYWMVFSNKGRLVKPGDRVSIAIGKFQADGLLVH